MLHFFHVPNGRKLDIFFVTYTVLLTLSPFFGLLFRQKSCLQILKLKSLKYRSNLCLINFNFFYNNLMFYKFVKLLCKYYCIQNIMGLSTKIYGISFTYGFHVAAACA